MLQAKAPNCQKIDYLECNQKPPKYSLDGIFLLIYIPLVACEVEFSDEFGAWWKSLAEEEQDSIRDVVALLRERGPLLGRPYADTLRGSKLANLKELRIQHQGRPYRVLFIFDPRRIALLLIGGDKTGNDRWYEEFVPKAEQIYAQFLREISEEKKNEGEADGT